MDQLSFVLRINELIMAAIPSLVFSIFGPRSLWVVVFIYAAMMLPLMLMPHKGYKCFLPLYLVYPIPSFLSFFLILFAITILTERPFGFLPEVLYVDMPSYGIFFLFALYFTAQQSAIYYRGLILFQLRERGKIV